MNCCSYVSMCLPLFISNALQPRENPVFQVHRIQLQESTKTGSVQWTAPVGQLVRCLYVVGARSSVLSVTPSALAASIYQPAGAFSHTKAYSWEQILRKDIKTYISIQKYSLGHSHTFLRHFYMLQAILGWPGRSPSLLGFALTWGELGKNKPYNPWPLFSSAEGHTHPRA